MDTTDIVAQDGSSSGPADPGATGEAGERSEDNGLSRQFVTFHVDHETFAVPLIEVQEIIRLPQMVEVPLAPASLAGLANLRGSVLPVTSLRRLFGLADVKHDDSTRVVVINRGRQVGFVVDRMASVVTSETSEIEGVEGLRSTVDTGLLSGMIKRASGMVMILDPGKLTQMGEGEGKRRQEKSDRQAEQLRYGTAAASADDETSDEMQLVSFELDGQEYALPIEHVQEIVQVPETITVIPNSASHVLGVMNLRNRLLPLVSLRSLFGLGATEVGDQSRILVIAFEMGKTVLSVGIVTDAVKEVLRVARSIVDPLPELLSHDGTLREVESVCRIDGGKRLVSILSAERLFSNATIRDALDAGTDQTRGPAMSETDDAKHGRADEEEQFVVFRLADEEYGVPIETVQEIVRIPDQLTRIPKCPSFIEGVVNLRGAVLSVVDQRRRFSLPNIERNDRQRIVVFTIDGVRTGFIVDAVSQVIRIPNSAISPAPELVCADNGAVSRVANLPGQKRMILMLEVSKLLSKREVTELRKTG